MNDPTGIEIEDLYSTKELEVLTLPYTWLSSEEGDVLITGVALTEGVWKNVIYSAKEIEKVAASLKGKPMLVEHGNTREFGDRSVGTIIKSYYEPSLRGIVFTGKVTDPLAKKLVKKEVLPAVSCSTWMEKRAVNDTIRIGSQYHFAEVSLCRVPACDRCFIFHKEQLSMLGKTKEQEKHLSIGKEPLMLGVKEMPKNEVESLAEVEAEEEQLSIEELEEPKLYVVLSLPDEESLEHLRNSQKVVSYYYGYQNSDYPSGYRRYGRSSLKKTPKGEKVILATIELDSKDKLEALRKTYNVASAFYGDAPQKLTKEELNAFAADLKAILQEFTATKERDPKKDLETGPLMEHQTGAPNPEQCQKVTCPVCDKTFEDVEKFMDHWATEHKEQYGAFKETMTLFAALSKISNLAKTREEKQADEGKDKNGCIIGKEEWDMETEKCIPVSKEEQSAYTDHIKKCMKTGKSMKACAASWEKEEKSAYTDFMKKCMLEKTDIENVGERMKACAVEFGKKAKPTEEKPEEKPAEPEEKQEFVCPACKEKFATEKELGEHWKAKHLEKIGPLKKGYKYPEKKSGTYYYYKLNGKYHPYYYKDKKYHKKYKEKKK